VQGDGADESISSVKGDKRRRKGGSKRTAREGESYMGQRVFSFDKEDTEAIQEQRSQPMATHTAQQNKKHQAADKQEGREVTAASLYDRVVAVDYRCELSGVKLKPEVCSLDHKTPLSRGGEHSMQNVAIVHPVVNRMKNTMTTEEFIHWCKLVADHADSQ